MESTILEYLKASLDEQLPVTIYLNGNQLRGVVSNINNAVVELRNENRRTVIRLERIEAVTRE